MTVDPIDTLITVAKRDGIAKLSSLQQGVLQLDTTVCERQLSARCEDEESNCEVLYLIETAAGEKPQQYSLSLRPSHLRGLPASHTPPMGEEQQEPAAATVTPLDHHGNDRESMRSTATIYGIYSTQAGIAGGKRSENRTTPLKPLLFPTGVSSRLQPRGGIQLRDYPFRTRAEVEAIAASGAGGPTAATNTKVASTPTAYFSASSPVGANKKSPFSSPFASPAAVKTEPPAAAAAMPAALESPASRLHTTVNMKEEVESNQRATTSTSSTDSLSSPASALETGAARSTPTANPSPAPVLMEMIKNALDELPPPKKQSVERESSTIPLNDKSATITPTTTTTTTATNANSTTSLSAPKPSSPSLSSETTATAVTPTPTSTTAGVKTQRQVSLFDLMAGVPKRVKTEESRSNEVQTSQTVPETSSMSPIQKEIRETAAAKPSKKKAAPAEKPPAKKKAPAPKTKKEATTTSKSLTKLAKASGKSAVSGSMTTSNARPASSTSQFLDDDVDAEEDNCFGAEDDEEKVAAQEEARLYQEMQEVQEESCVALDVIESHENDEIILCDDTPPFVFVAENMKSSALNQSNTSTATSATPGGRNKLPSGSVAPDPNGLKNFFHPAVLAFQKSFTKNVETEMKVVDGEYICSEVVVYRCDASGEVLSQDEFHRRSSAIAANAAAAATAATQEEEESSVVAEAARRSDELQRTSAGHSSVGKSSSPQTAARPSVVKRAEPQESKGLAFFFGKK